MRAVVIENGEVTVAERPDPVPGKGELLIKVDAAGLNGADLLQKAGFYPPPPGVPPDIPGLECAGSVVATGPGDTRFKPGDRVMSIVGGGGQAELCTVPDSVAMAVPGSLDSLAAGGFPEVFTTAHDALFTQCDLREEEALLVTGAAGGVGLAAIQLATRLRGAKVTASVRNLDLREKVAAFGAVAVAPEDAEQAGPYDVVLELVGGPNLEGDLRALAPNGRIVVIGIGAGARTEIDLRQVMAKRATIKGSTLRARSLEDKAAAAHALERDVAKVLERGDLRVAVEDVFPACDTPGVRAAYERFAAGGKLGKILLDFRGGEA
ncbi:MAG: zinc-binding dehydrogenase [Acidimicrobiales bacterium]